jgi:hypothetical protein
MSVVSGGVEPLTFIFEDDGLVPNNPMPLLVYQQAVDVDNDHPEKTIEGLFGANGWGEMWRNGVYDYLHYHATVHEVLGAGTVRRRPWPGDRDFSRRCRDPARRYRASMPLGEPRFRRGRGLSAGTEHARHAADAGEPCQGVADGPGGKAAEDRSGAGRSGAAGEIVEARLAVRHRRRRSDFAFHARGYISIFEYNRLPSMPINAMSGERAFMQAP